ncbi:hypothetical protein BDY19DRAFT_622534 [Irpex rosettiformis]|uniref:Uncharacterized protein n=1 Tax=Irpex rosettiformis TaxID=378272 RepID=A0ACB8UAP0_9APHY|nr:hypothetical protein BDY19DRAFT_622534 [Irpex rosettiformis]
MRMATQVQQRVCCVPCYALCVVGDGRGALYKGSTTQRTHAPYSNDSMKLAYSRCVSARPCSQQVGLIECTSTLKEHVKSGVKRSPSFRFWSSKINIATRVCVLVGDTLAVLLTWIKTYRNVKELHKAKSTTLTKHLMRNGTLYFIALLALNLSMLLIKNTTLVTSILHTCMGVLVSRFILDLRGVTISEANKYGTADSCPSTLSQVSLGQANEEMLNDV